MDVIEVNFWIKSKKYTRKIDYKVLKSIIRQLNDKNKYFISFIDDTEWKILSKKDITEIRFDKKTYDAYKEQEKIKRQKATINEEVEEGDI